MEAAQLYGGGVSRYPMLGLAPLMAVAQGTLFQQELAFLAGACLAFYAVIFLIWILIGVWVYRDANSRGMNGALWLVVVLLVGIIGLIIYLVLRQDKPAPLAAPVPPVPGDAYGAVEGTGAEAGQPQGEDVMVSKGLMKAGKRMDKVWGFNKLPTELRVVVVLLIVVIILMWVISYAFVGIIESAVEPSGDNRINPNKLDVFSDTETVSDYLTEYNDYPITLDQLMGGNVTFLVGTVNLTLEWTDEPDQTQLGRVRENQPDNFQLELNVGGNESWTVTSDVVGNSRDPSGGSGMIDLSVDVSALVDGYVNVGNLSGKFIAGEVIYADNINIVVHMEEAEDLYASGPALLKWNDFGNDFTLTVSCTGLVVPTD